MELAARDEESGFPLMCVCDHIINHSEFGFCIYEVGIMIQISIFHEGRIKYSTVKGFSIGALEILLRTQ